MSAPQLAPWRHRFPGRMAGSVYAAPPASRVAAAQVLSSEGLDVHVDLMAESEGLPAGISMTELHGIAETVDPARIGIHLIGSVGFVERMLPKILPLGPAMVFIPWKSFTDERAGAIRSGGAQAWIALWKEWDGVTGPEWPATPDGALVMLIEPGTRNPCTLGRLAVVTACASKLPVAVDGGITEAIAELCYSAGAQSIVVGRALLIDQNASNSGEALAASNEGTQ